MQITKMFLFFFLVGCHDWEILETFVRKIIMIDPPFLHVAII